MFRNKEKITNKSLLQSYRESENDLYLKRFKIVLIIAFIFVTFFGILDFIIYHEKVHAMWFVRLIGDIIILITLLIYKKLNKYIRCLSYLAVTTFYLCINALIFLTEEGASSPYYAGLTLTLVALSTIIPWNGKQTAIIAIENVILYLINIVVYSIYSQEYINIALLMNNLFFMISTSTFCVVAKHLDSTLRFKQFCLNYELNQTLANLKRTQGQLIHSEKINAIGNLSAGLLHEINNPLNYVSIAVNMIKEEKIIKKNENLKDYVNDIDEGINRVSTIVKDLRSFAYPDEDLKNEEFKITDIIEKARRFTSSQMQDIIFKTNIVNNITIKASPNHIIQIFVNLFTNSCKAINKKNIKDGKIIVSAIKTKDHIKIIVSDNGIGMTQETANRIFEPFYTTREVGEGMGLGLSICHTILKNYNATIITNSTENQGTNFILTFPNYEK